jgi:AcrR family transcriptional regulator
VIEPVWTKAAPGSRKARLSRDQVAAAALALAEAEGIEAVTMRRVAAEVGLGTMSLYHYAPTKRDLLTLINEAILAELLVPDSELGDDWRTRLGQIARRARSVWQRRRWAIGSLGNAPPFGPNGMRNLEQSLAAITDLPLDPAEKLKLVHLIQDYVLGFVLGDFNPEPTAKDRWVPTIGGYIAQQLETGSFPHAQAVFGDPDPGTVLRQLTSEATNDERFEAGLTCLLDGIALRLHTLTGSRVESSSG